MLLAQKNIVIIGGTGGLGLSAARACTAAGARVCVVGRSPESVAKALAELPAGQAEGLSGDAADPATAELAISRTVARWGRLDGLYHVAGGSGRRAGDGPLHEVTEEGIDRTLGMNLEALIRSNRAAVRQFLAQGGGGAILNMGSVLGWSPSPHYFATHVYAAAKSAIVGFSRSVAAHYAAQNIRVNVVAPALVDTPMARRAAEDSAIQAFIRTKQPLDGGRIGCPEDCDAAVVMLLSDGAKFITGQVLAVDGGWCVSEGQLPG